MVVAMAAEPLDVPPLQVSQEVMVGMVVRQEVAVVRLGLVLVQAQMGKVVTEQEEKYEYFHGR